MKCVLLIYILSSTVCFIKAAPALPLELSPSENEKNPYKEDMKHRYYIGLECLEDTKANVQVITKAVQNPLNLPDDGKYKDFLTCSFKKQGFQAPNGKMQYEAIKEFLSRYYSLNDLKVLDECKSVTAETHSQIAFDSLKCVFRKLTNLTEKAQEYNEI